MKGPTLEVSGPAAEAVASDGGMILNIPIALRRRSGRRVVVPEGPGFKSEKRLEQVPRHSNWRWPEGTGGSGCWRPAKRPR